MAYKDFSEWTFDEDSDVHFYRHHPQLDNEVVHQLAQHGLQVSRSSCTLVWRDSILPTLGSM